MTGSSYPGNPVSWYDEKLFLKPCKNQKKQTLEMIKMILEIV
jgi:hypothetical protein